MTRGVSMAARGIAIAIAIAAVADPEIGLPRSERPPVRIANAGGRDATPVSNALKKAGFTIDPAAHGATVLLTERAPDARAVSPDTWILDTSAAAPNVRIAAAATAGARLPGQALDVRVTLEAAGVAGKTTELVLEDSGIPVASAKHPWTADRERWDAALQYLPPTASGGRLRVNAAMLAGETGADDNAVDVAVPPLRGPVRTLVVEAAVTWPALFVRRALEGESAFAVSALQRASKGVETRAGGPPLALTRGALAGFEVVVVGGPDSLTAADLEALRWFIEARGGVALFVPDQRPAGRYTDLVGVTAFEPREFDAPVRLGPDLLASELLVPGRLPSGAMPLAADAAGTAVVFSARRGMGAVMFSGALDAWRHRGLDAGAFARFWRRVLASNALAVPPALEVTAEPALARPGERVTVTARVRDTDIPPGATRIEMAAVGARAVRPDAKIDAPIRLWPTVEPGVFSGTWRAGRGGDYDISVSAGPLRGDAAVTVDPAILYGSPEDPQGLGLFTRASGGQVFRADRVPALAEAMAAAYPARRAVRPSHPMRSAWWCVPFAGLLCAEWALRRRHGWP